mmetsp:Transcript_32777/g.60412  ORF Transcript_32777/g.60412 Transcript_32777/m.60412 type:complete len:224 (-) Transcript_32777:77-748(-)
MSSPKTASDVFRQIDVNGDGKISKSEYSQALQMMNIPKEIASITTEAVFSKFDANSDGGIDEKEFVKYFSENDAIALHQRLDRALFEGKYIVFWGCYFCFVGMKILSSPLGLVGETFGDLDPNDAVGNRLAAAQIVTILGLAWFTNGALVLMQRLLKIEPVAAHSLVAIFWFVLTLYEMFVGPTYYPAYGFKEPPMIAVVLSGLLAAFGGLNLLKGKAKIKEA